MSTRNIRRLERFKKVYKGKSIPEKQGRGKAQAREAKAIAVQASVALKKNTGKAMKELEGLGVAELQEKLAASRQELLFSRFKHATAQLTDVASLPAVRRRIARILTLIKQKELGA